MCEFSGSGFDIAAAAGWYSAIAGLLAGFALLAVLLPLDHETPDRSEKSQQAAATGVIVFTSAFFSLVILAFTYAILSGRTAGAVAAQEQQLNGAAFGLSALLMFLGLREILHIYGGNRQILSPAQDLIDRVVGIYGPIVVIAMTFSNTLDITAMRFADSSTTKHCIGDLPASVWINAGVSILAVLVILALPFIGQHIHIDTAIESYVARATLGFTIFVAIWAAAFLPFLPDQFVASALLEHFTLGLTATGTVAFGTAAWLSR